MSGNSVGRPRPSDFDKRLGLLLRAKRLELGWPQQRLGLAVGLTFQQIQKYERGTNRIPLSRLLDLCKALGQPWQGFIAEALEADKNETMESIGNGHKFRTLARVINRLNDKQVAAAVKMLDAMAKLGRESES